MNNLPLEALSNAAANGNGVYVYANGGGFPTNTFSSTNYWVDLVFVPTATYTISGTITGGSGATINLTGAATASVTAGSSGNYSFTGLVNGAYTVTPSETGFSFSPTNQSVTVNGANVTGINFTATAVPTYSISGTITGGGGATVTLSGAASATVTANSSGNYSFSGLANGSYTVTPTESGVVFTPANASVTVNGSNITGVNFTTQPGISIDVTVSKDQGTASTTVATPSFSTTAGNELVLAFVATDYSTGTNTTVSSITGAGLTWTLVKRTNTQRGTAEIWRALAAAALSNVTVTATLSQRVASSMTVMSFAGISTSGPVGATGTGNAASGAPTASLVTTVNNSWVFGVGNDWDNAIARTPATGQSIIHQYLSSSGDTYWVQMQTNTTSTAGTTVKINDTAPTTDRYNLTICEIIP